MQIRNVKYDNNKKTKRGALDVYIINGENVWGAIFSYRNGKNKSCK